MHSTLRLATASINTTALDVDGNLALIRQAIAAAPAGTQLLLLPELALTGYGCEDMFFASDWLEPLPLKLLALADELPDGLVVAVGLPLWLPGGQLFNAVAVLSRGQLHGLVCKQVLARNGIHYEPRWFTPWPAGQVSQLQVGSQQVAVGDLVFDIDGIRFGFEVCEDSWVANRPGRSLYNRRVDLILNPSASHFAIGKAALREQFITEGSRAFGVIYAYANLLGCEAGRAIYDGGNLIASGGQIVLRGQRLAFAPLVVDAALVDLLANRAQRLQSSQMLPPDDGHGLIQLRGLWPEQDDRAPLAQSQPPLAVDEADEVLRAVALGLWDWQRKTATRGYVVSLSGGADSALCASAVYLAHAQALATLGASRYGEALAGCGLSVDTQQLDLVSLQQQLMAQLLTTVYQGSSFSGSVTRDAAASVAAGVGARHHQWSIAELVDGYIARANAMTPDQPLDWAHDDLALQNIQARVRSPGIWLVANRENKLLLTTSNLSEASVGYCTMDGDTSGVLAPIGGISKSRVLRLLAWLHDHGLPLANGQRLTLPCLAPVITQQPTAELRPVEQTDEADLMPFEVLDAVRALGQTQHLTPLTLFKALGRTPLGQRYGQQQLGAWVVRYYRLYCRNQWKRERLAVSFHIETDSADPKTYRRFPVLSSALRSELAALERYLAGLASGA